MREGSTAASTGGEDRVDDFGLAPGESFEPDELPEPSLDLATPHVMTVLGPIRPEELGPALHHEHLFANPPAVAADEPDFVLDDRHATLAELEDFYAAGGRGIVDASPADYGRDVGSLRWVAERAPVHVVAVTGHHKALHAERLIGDRGEDELAAVMVHELTEGVADTGVRPGVIKAGTSLDAVLPVEATALRAAALAHLATGAPITTHTEQGTMAPEQLAILASEGVDPSRVILGHLDRKLEEGYLRGVLETGAFVSFDSLSNPRRPPDGPKAAMVRRLVEAGYGDQLLLSQDLARRSALRAYGGQPGWTAIFDRFALLLLEEGLSAMTVRRLLVDNVARALTVRR